MKKLKYFVIIMLLIIPMAFVGCKDDNKEYLSTPKNLVVQDNGIIVFERVDNDGYYVVSINGTELIVNPSTNQNDEYTEIYNQNGINYLKYDASRLLNVGESYNVKVKACADGKKESEYTSVVNYEHHVKIDTPELNIVQKTLTWNVVAGASGYEVKVVSPDDTETVYYYTTNRFDFESILSVAGEYKFYVNAISASALDSNSGYGLSATYLNSLSLATPKNVEVVSLYGYCNLSLIIDKNANAVKLTLNDQYTKVVELENLAVSQLINTNRIFVNLESVFAEECTFEAFAQYKVSVQAIYKVSDEQVKLYTNSQLVDNIIFGIKAKLVTPTVTVSDNTLVWELNESASAYMIYVVDDTGVNKYRVNAESYAFELPTNWQMAGVQALGAGYVEDSTISSFVCAYEDEWSADILASINDGVISWTSVADTIYCVSDGNDIYLCESAEFDYSNVASSSLIVYIIKPNYMPKAVIANVVGSKKLSAPQNLTANKYQISFDAVENAYAYQVVLTRQNVGSNTPILIGEYFTETTIDLSPYIINGGSYDVQVRAVAKENSIYTTSDLTSSGSVTISYIVTLDTPQFRKDTNLKDAPIVMTKVGSKYNYTFNFYGVKNAYQYQIKINSSVILVPNDNREDLYSVDVSDLLTSAGNYLIELTAVPLDNTNRASSNANAFVYSIYQQLKPVTNINITQNEMGRLILSFDLQDSASSYKVEIIRINDSTYTTYIKNELHLTLPFEVNGSCEITQYLEKNGDYNVFVTALADKNQTNIADGDRSVEYATWSKKSTLSIPTFNINFYQDVSQYNFTINWNASEHADYYVINVKSPSGKTEQYVSYTNKVNINPETKAILREEGQYIVNVKAVVDTMGENADLYESSSFSDNAYINYSMAQKYDFERYEMYMYGGVYNLAVNDVVGLTNALWYNYLFPFENKLKIYIDTDTDETVRQAITRFALEAQSEEYNLYAFDTDSDWQTLLLNANVTDATLLAYVSEKLLQQYPEMAVLNGFSCTSSTIGDNVFEYTYTNKLNGTKTISVAEDISLPSNYDNKFTYLKNDTYSRRDSGSAFAIDKLDDTMEVTTTEQLLMAVEYGKRPVFVGDSTEAELVYSNAKAVLVAIATNRMTDLEKATAIFDWLSYAYNIDLNAKKVRVENVLTEVDIEQYGLKAEYYLEGIFAGLNDSQNGGYDGEFYLGNKVATSESLTKAFILLCGIEGIQARKVNGEISYNSTVIKHTWARVYVATNQEQNNATWYNVDIAYSNTKFNASDVSASYSVSSHLFYLVSDDFYMNGNLNFGTTVSVPVTITEYELTVLPTSLKISPITTSYEYYSNSSFAMTYEEILATLYNDNVYADSHFKYCKMFDSSVEYQKYYGTDYEGIQGYVLNSLVYAKHLMLTNGTQQSSFELVVGSSQTSQVKLQNVLGKLNMYYKMIDTETQNISCSFYSTTNTATNQTIYVFTLQYK